MRIAAEDTEIAGRIQPENPVDLELRWHLVPGTLGDRLIGPLVDRQHQRAPAELGKMLRESECPLNAAAASHRWKMKGDEKDSAQRWFPDAYAAAGLLRRRFSPASGLLQLLLQPGQRVTRVVRRACMDESLVVLACVAV
jgi:hypothetical protein